MAEILHGVSNHQTHAPLSQAQTVAMGQHLHDLHLGAMKQIQELRDELSRTSKEVSMLSNQLNNGNGTITAMQKDLEVQKGRLDAVASESGLSTIACAQLKGGMLKAHEGIGQLREGQKMTNTNVHCLKADVGKNGADIKRLRADLDDLINNTISEIGSKLSGSILSVAQLSRDHDVSRRELAEHTHSIKQLTAGAKESKDDVGKLSASATKHSKQIAELSGKAEATKSNLEITNGVVMKLHNSIEATKNDVSKLQTDMDRLDSEFRRQVGSQGSTLKIFEELKDDFGKLRASVAEIRAFSTGTRNQLQELELNHGKSVEAIDALSTGLDRVRGMCESTQTHLDETNAMVLPNLRAEDNSAPGFSGTIGSSGTTRQKLGPPAGKLTPRMLTQKKRREDAAWISKNIGLIPDRMAYI